MTSSASKSHSTQPPLPTDPEVAYRTAHGVMYRGNAETVLTALKKRRARAQLIFTSPPFPLNSKKKYGNLQGADYTKWMTSFAAQFRDVLRPDGSLVIELGNAWEPGRPVMSTLALRTLLEFVDSGQFSLCQQFVVHNPARLPSPAQWVTIERIRVKDAYTHVWWMSRGDRPKANNRQILKPYSRQMLRLFKNGEYNAGPRPSEHHISDLGFFTDNGGAIPSNVLTFANTSSSDSYLRYCRTLGLPLHPARMPAGVADFFIKFLTSKGDLVIDPFAGSNTTGAVAERLGRRWIAIETDEGYIEGSKGRFPDSIIEVRVA